MVLFIKFLNNKELKKEEIIFITIEKSYYKEFSYIIVKTKNNKFIKFKIDNDFLARTILKKEQNFILYYYHDGDLKCSVKLERNFAGIDVISNEKKCY